jgi:hypothetical protein
MSRALSRRSLLSSASYGLPALAVGGALFGRSVNALAAPKMSKAPSTAKIVGPEGELKLVTDLALPKQLQPAAEATLQKVRAALTIAAAHPDKKFSKNKLAAASSRFVEGLKATRIVRAKGRAAAVFADKAKATKALGGYADATVAAWQADKGLDVHIKHAFEKVPADYWAELTKKLEDKVVLKKPKYSKLEFHLNTMRCIAETAGEVDSDEILFGGELVRPDGIVRKIDAFKVSDDFDTGEVKYYDSAQCIGVPPAGRSIMEDAGVCNGHYSDPYRGRVLVSTDLDGPWPGTYALVLLMVEEDYGGFNELLRDLYAAVEDEVKKEIDAASAEAGQQISGDAIGEIIGEVIAWVVTELVDWLASLLDNADDPIATRSWIITLQNATKDWFNERTAGGLEAPAGQRASKIKRIDFNGDGGKYRARMHFRALS